MLIIGDIMLDHYLIGEVDRISPEAPVPIVKLEDTKYRLGGAANVAANIKAMGGEPIICTVIGKDKEGNKLLDLLKANDISTEAIYSSKDRITTCKTRVLARNQHLLRLDQEQTNDINTKETQKLLNWIDKIIAIQKPDVIVFQDYNKGVLTINLIRKVLLESIKNDIPTLVDPKYRNFFEYKEVTLFKPNLKEILSVFPKQKTTITPLNLVKLSHALKAKLNNKNTLITLSENGVFFHSLNAHQIIPAKIRDIADVCGAGDTVISAAAMGLASGWNMYEIALFSNLAGGLVCEEVGVVPVNFERLLSEFQDEMMKTH